MLVSSPKKSFELFEEHVNFLSQQNNRGINYGIEYIDQYLLPLQPTDLAFVIARPGHAKCMGRGTRVVMFDGSLKAVEDIKPGDQLLGPDSTPRNVISTTSGFDKMYWIRQSHAQDYMVNGDHILSLRKKNFFNDGYRQINISVNEVLNKPRLFLSFWKGYKSSVEFGENKKATRPYFSGMLLGTENQSIMPYGSDIDPEQIKANISYYAIASRKQRLEFLAGFVTANATVENKNYLLSHSQPTVLKSIKYIADSLGFGTKLSSDSLTLELFGDLESIPSVIKSKKVQNSRRFANNYSTIKIEYYGYDEYYGFELDKDGLYLLEDFTVTHNTSIMTHYSFRGAELYEANQGDYAPPIFITAEMPIEALMLRSVSRYTGIDSKFLLTGKQNVNWKYVLGEASKMVGDIPIIYAGNSLYEGKRGPIYLNEIVEIVDGVSNKFGKPPAMVCIDYIQRIKHTAYQNDRRMAMNEIVEVFKDMAIEYKTPVLSGSQALRAVDSRPFPVPGLQDGKETGGIEEAADWVISCVRPSRYWKVGGPIPNSNHNQIVTELLFFLKVLKQRSGDAGEGFWLEFDPTVGSFDSLGAI